MMKTKKVNFNGHLITLIRYRNMWVFPYVTTYNEGAGFPIALILYSLIKTWNPFARKRRLEEYTRVTVNLPNCKRSAGCQYIDVNNNHPDIIEWLEKNGFGRLSGRTGQSGFCIYPEFSFAAGKTFRKYHALCLKWITEGSTTIILR